ncbi:MAG: hypothetical protein J6C06_02505 [Lachnospiraceae bacterium]|nr:hypothetical protein [Lachnospiraceae bacterium]
MSEVLTYILLIGWMPLLFIIIGVIIAIQGGKQLYHSQFASVKVSARCIDVQKIQEDGRTLYRPVYEYVYNGRTIHGTRLDYDEASPIAVNDMNMTTVYVDKKHPDIVVDTPGSAAPAVVKLVIGVIFAYTALQIIVPMLLMLLFEG